jgi:hypothetical protein
MTVLIRIEDESGRETRRCDARCHRADPSSKAANKSRCCCGGILRGIERKGVDPLSLSDDYLNWVRMTVVLRPGEHVQMRFGA